ncbi:methionine--tRNA ligase [Salinispira pacifica]|uniref:Methionine--tRNA ligase n=1 Tax=Salinispira pacifica TaxID=1307761 RepID=V5WHG6_9SPIO|nr:methionine--tRNA ligase [Salinispira pacifica]AHC14989.1 Methionyl-tRNA synthetase [Salinispira pacifica]
MKKRLVTSALPYVNNIPHLGNLIQVLSADVFARFSRQKGYDTLYICGSDEYGTATETRAREEGMSPRELCDKNHAIHKDIYEWFNINFDHYGRTSTEFQTRIVQDIFTKVYNNGYINQHTIKQLYSEKSEMFLADRYVKGECPHCHYDDARGDQCEHCGKLLDPEHLINPVSIMDNSTPVLKETTHLYLDLPKVLPLLQEWMDEASERGKWARNAVQMTQAWIRDGLKERAITRDLKWGIPVPLEGFEDKVFYVWFDAPIGYISISAEYAAKSGDPDGWKEWWLNPDEVELFQFIGKDNIPFHTVIFPSSQLASGDDWTMLHHMSSSEYMNYEGGKFSKSKGIGVFGNDAKDTGIPADVWRFYIFYNRPETSDYVFTWKDFQEKTNKELIGNLANLVNRTLSFSVRFFDGKLPVPDLNNSDSSVFWKEVTRLEQEITTHLEWAQLRDAFRKIFALASYGNKVFQESEPWKLRESNPGEAQRILSDLAYLVRDLSILVRPYIPETAERIAAFLGMEAGAESADWSKLGSAAAVEFPIPVISSPEILFKQLDGTHIEELRKRFAGSQAERAEAAAQKSSSGGESDKKSEKKKLSKAEKIRKQDEGLRLDQRFTKRVELRVAKIVKIERHPEAEKLYIETLDDGSGEERSIVSGLVPHYKEEELLNRNIILVANLKPAKLRGVKSHGMLLAASSKAEGEEVVDVIFADHAQPGDQVHVSGLEPQGEKDRIDIDTFFDIPLTSENHEIAVGGKPLQVAGKALRSAKVANGAVG